MEANKKGQLEIVNDSVVDEIVVKSERELKETVKRHAYMAAVAKQMMSSKNHNAVL